MRDAAACAADADTATLPGVHVLRDFIPRALCEELIFTAQTLPTPGYRPGVSACLLPLLARAAPGLLPPLLAVRDRVRDAAEALDLGHACADTHSGAAASADALASATLLFVEFTGLLAWHGASDHAGARLGWHDDASGGPHLTQARRSENTAVLGLAVTDAQQLAQRHVSAVLYLNTAGEAFGGGDFCCEPPGGGQVSTLAPRAGTLLLYRSTQRHAVAPVSWGDRHTLAVWLTRDAAHAEDAALLGPGRPFAWRGPLEPAALAARPGALEAIPDAMFCGSGGGVDMRVRALQARGLLLAPSCAGDDDGSAETAAAPAVVTLLRAAVPTEALPLRFRDVTHALQVALFAEWRYGAALASMPAASVLDAAAAWEAHDAAGRAAVAALLPRWRAASALFGPD